MTIQSGANKALIAVDPKNIQDMTNALYGLDAATQKAALSTLAKNGADVAAVQASLANLASKNLLSVAQAKEIALDAISVPTTRAAASALIEEAASANAATIGVAGLTQAELVNILASADMTAADAASAVAKGTATTATAMQTGATNALTASITTAAKATWAWIAANPATILFAVAAAAFVAVVAFDALNISVEKQQKTFADATSAYSEAQSKVDELSKSLQEAGKRKEELSKKAGLTIVEQQELKLLEQQTKEYRTQLALAKELSNEKATGQIGAAKGFITKKGLTMHETSNENNENVQVSEVEYITQKANSLDKLNKSREEARQKVEELAQAGKQETQEYKDAKENYEGLDRQYKDTKSTVNGLVSSYKEQVDALKKAKAAGKDIGEDGENQIKMYDDWSNKIVQVVDPLSTVSEKSEKFNTIWNSANFSENQAKLLDLANAGKLTAKDIDELAKSNADLKNFMDSSGISAGQLVTHINSLRTATAGYLVEAKSVPSLYNELKDKAKAVGTAQKEMRETGVVAGDTMADLIKTGVLTEDQFIATADGFKISEVALRNLDAAALQTYEDSLTKAQEAATAVVDAELRKAEGYDGTTKSILLQLYAQKAQYEAQLKLESSDINSGKTGFDFYDKTVAAINSIVNAQNNLNKATSVFNSMRNQKDTSKTQHYKDFDYDKFYAEKKKVSDIELKIADVEAKLNLIDEDTVEGLKQKNKLLEEENILYVEKQEALHALNEARRAEIAAKAAELSALGIDVKYDADTNDLTINYEQIAKLSGVAQEKAAELSKEMETLNKENQGASATYRDLAGNINKNTKAMRDNLQAAAKLEYDKLKDSVENYIDELEKKQKAEVKALNDQKDALEKLKDASEKYYKDKIAALKKDKEAAQDARKKIEDENKLLELKNDLLKAQKELQNTLNEKNTKQLQGNEWVWVADPQKVLELQEKMREAQKKYDEEVEEQSYEAQLKAFDDAIDELEDLQKKSAEQYEAQIKLLEEQLKTVNDSYDKTIDSLKEQLSKAENLLKFNANNICTSLDQVNQAFTEFNRQLLATRQAASAALANKAAANGQTAPDSSSSETNVSVESSDVPTYHSGTSGAGGKTIVPGQNELFALLEKGEPVLSAKQLSNNMGLISSLAQMAVPNFSNSNTSVSSEDHSVNIGELKVIANGGDFDKIINTAKQASRRK